MQQPVRATSFFSLLAVLTLFCCGPEEKPPDIPDEVVAAYDKAVGDCIAEVERAEPIRDEIKGLLSEHQAAIETAIKSNSTWPFTYRFDDSRFLTIHNQFKTFQAFITMPSQRNHAATSLIESSFRSRQ